MTFKAACLLSFILLVPLTASAGPYTDELSRCLVASTTADDRIALVRWLFVAFSARPSVAPISAVKPSDVDKANAQVGNLFIKVLTDACREKTKTALRYEGSVVIQSSFQVLGQVAGMELSKSPEVSARLSGVSKQVDEKKIKALVDEPIANPAKETLIYR